MLSVIIPTRNRPGSLARTLESLAKQRAEFPDFEVIVVNNGDDSEADSVCQRLRHEFSVFRLIVERRPGLHRGRHCGMRAAQSENLVFIDDDIQAMPGWLAGISERFRNADVKLLCGKCLPRYDAAPPAWLTSMWERSGKDGARVLGALSLVDLGNSPRPLLPGFAFGCNFAVKREALLRAGGFHPDGFPANLRYYRGDGETHVARWLSEHGFLCEYEPRSAILHDVTSERMTRQYFRDRSFAQGISESYRQIRADRGIRPSTSAATVTRTLASLVKAVRGVNALLTTWSFWSGYWSHRKRVAATPELKAWVLQSNYLDE